MAQISTAVSDGVVAATAYYVAYHILMSHLVAKVGFLVIAIAATCGAARYGMRSPPSELVRYHELFTWLSSVMGVAFVAAMYMYLANMPLAGLALTATSLLLLLLWNSLPTDVRRRAPEGAAGVSLVSILAVSLMRSNLYGAAGAIAYIVSAVVVGTTGSISGWRRVDVFHYGIAFGNLALFLGMYGGYPPK